MRGHKKEHTEKAKPVTEDSEALKYIVVTEFRDIANINKVHSVGKDVSDFDKKRLDRLEGLGLVEKK